MKLWPRLPLARARVLAAEFEHCSLAQLKSRPWTGTSARLFAPTGGVPVENSTLTRLRSGLEDVATDAGFPTSKSRLDQRRFDDGALKFMADFGIPFGEAIRAETWAWVAVVLVPHLVSWRWPESSDRLSRFAGPLVRNAIGRLWYQAHSLDAGGDESTRWRFCDVFGSDQAVALLERPSLASNRELCLAIGRVWLALPKADRKEVLFRETMKGLIVRAGILRLDLLDSKSLDAAVADTFAKTRRRLRE